MNSIKEEQKCTELIVIDNNIGLIKKRKNNRILKFFSNIILKISKLILKLIVIVSIYSMIFSTAVYYSNQFMVMKLRESEENKKKDPVLEALRKDRNKEITDTNNADKSINEEEK